MKSREDAYKRSEQFLKRSLRQTRKWNPEEIDYFDILVWSIDERNLRKIPDNFEYHTPSDGPKDFWSIKYSDRPKDFF